MIESRQRRVALLVASCFFMENLDGTIVTTAAPRIGAALHVTSGSIGLVITAYLITLAVLIPLSGWMVARLGTRKVFASAIVIFTFASLMCSTSVNLGELVAFRVLQGAGGAMMVPVGRLAVLSKTAKPDLLRMMSFIVWPGLVAPVIAPLAGGLITTYASWRWLFLINIPLGIVALVLAIRLMPSSPTTTPPRLDVLGVVLTCGGLGGITYTAHLLSVPRPSWSPITVIGSVSLILLVATVRHLLRSDAPLVDLRTLRTRSFRNSVGGGSLFWLTVGAVPFLLPLLFENVFGWSPVKAGSIVLFVFVGNIGIKPATTFLLNRFGFRTILTIATSVVAATVIVAGLLTGATPLGVVIVVTLISGAARSLGLTGYGSLGMSEIPEAQMRHANSLAATAQQLSAGLAVAVATVALRAGIPIGNAISGHPTIGTSYTVAFFLLALGAMAAGAGAVRLAPDAGNAVRTRVKANA